MNNTIEKNGNWESSKIKLESNPTGGTEFFTSPESLSEEKLHLSSMHGFEELIYKNEGKFEKASFEFKLEKNAYIYFIFNHNETGFSAIRLSNNKLFHSSYIESHINNQFYKNQKIDFKLNENWNKFSINFHSDYIEVNLNQEILEIRDIKLKEKFRVGFKSSLEDSIIDNFYLVSNQQTFKEKFNPKISLLPDFFKYFAILSLINLLLIIVLIKENKIPKIILLNATTLVILLCLFLLAKNQLPAVITKTKNLITNQSFKKENQEKSVLDSNQQLKEIVEKVNQQVLLEKIDENKNLILLIGTSQTWGQGSSKFEFSFAEELEKRVSKENNDWQLVNSGIPGANSLILLELYEKNWLLLEPDIVLINLSFNDFDPKKFKNNLEKFANINNEKNIKTVFILEANTIELSQKDNVDYSNRQIVMKEIAEKQNIPIIDMQNHINKFSDSGILWWDVIHPTDYGHSIIAEKIYNFLVDNKLIN